MSSVSEDMSSAKHVINERPSIILYDGVCGFCNRFTAFVLARDEDNLFRFASLQSRFAVQTLGKGRTANLDTVYVIAHAGESCEQVLCKSEAVLFVLTRLRATAAIGRALRIIPKPLADQLYNLFARYRYALFGELNICASPTRGQQSKFIES
jgi:predicted DCC family thiol-disulfide oxidoreductase YuxK